MHKFPKFILLAYVHSLNIWLIFMLVQNTCETAFHFGGGVQLENTVVKQGRKPLSEIWEAGERSLQSGPNPEDGEHETEGRGRWAGGQPFKLSIPLVIPLNLLSLTSNSSFLFLFLLIVMASCTHTHLAFPIHLSYRMHMRPSMLGRKPSLDALMLLLPSIRNYSWLLCPHRTSIFQCAG